MKGKIVIPVIVFILLLVAGIVCPAYNLSKQQQHNQEMQELAEPDKQEMESGYQRFADQYNEVKAQISNDSIVAQLTEEQEKTKRLLNKLKQVKSNDAREIARLKKELATVRTVLRSYVMEIDSLSRLSQNLTKENTHIKGEYGAANRQIEGLSTEKVSLSEKVTVTVQLDATGINLSLRDKRGRATERLKRAKALQVDLSIVKSVTATNGMRTLYMHIVAPTENMLDGAGTFPYGNKSLQATAEKTVEYSGQQTSVIAYWDIDQVMVSGIYQVSIFAEGNMIGSRSLTLG